MSEPPVPPATIIDYVFVDYENVSKMRITSPIRKNVVFTLVAGPLQSTLDKCLIEQLLELTLSVRMVQLETPGPNALDFLIAYHVGRAAAADPAGRFHIISKDTGFDPLVEHLLRRNIFARRHPDCRSIFSEDPIPPSLIDRLEVEIPRILAKMGGRPRMKKTLIETLRKTYRKRVPKSEIEQAIYRLQKTGYLTLSPSGKIIYLD